MEDGETTSANIIRHGWLSTKRAFSRTRLVLTLRGHLALMPIEWGLGFFAFYLIRGWPEVADRLMEAVAFMVAPMVTVAVAVFIACLLTEPARIYAEGEAAKTALRTEIEGLSIDPDRKPLVCVEGLQENGPVVRITALVGVKRMRVRVRDWDQEGGMSPTRICFLEWPGGSDEIGLAKGDPVLLNLGTFKGRDLRIPKCARFEGRGHARDTDVQWHHDICLRFSDLETGSQDVWVRYVVNWSVHDPGHYTANSTEVLPENHEPSREPSVSWEKLVQEVKAS